MSVAHEHKKLSAHRWMPCPRRPRTTTTTTQRTSDPERRLHVSGRANFDHEWEHEEDDDEDDYWTNDADVNEADGTEDFGFVGERPTRRSAFVSGPASSAPASVRLWLGWTVIAMAVQLRLLR